MRINSLKITFYSNVTFLFLIKSLVGCAHAGVEFLRRQNAFGEMGA